MIKVFETFAGFGGWVFSLKKLGIPFESVGHSEIDDYAIKCYDQNHSSKNYGDIKKIIPNELPDFDLLCSSPSCQSFSTAGKGLGNKDVRGDLFEYAINIMKEKQPKYAIYENVKGLVSKDHIDYFNYLIKLMKDAGYMVEWKVLNTKDYGVPQNRERVFIVCIRNDNKYFAENLFTFPKKQELKLFLKDILESGFVDREVSYCIDANYFKGTNVKSYFDKHRRQIVFEIKDKGIVPIEENRSYMIGNLKRYNMRSVRVPYAQFKGVAWALGTTINQAVYWGRII